MDFRNGIFWFFNFNIMVESTGIKPYQFKPTDVSGYNDDDDDSSESETDIREQISQNAWEQWIGASARNVHPCPVALNASVVRVRWKR